MPSFAEAREALAGAGGSIAAALEGVERWLLPPACLLCGRDVPGSETDALVCALCRMRWSPVPHPVCLRCGQPRSGDDDCLLCAAWPDSLYGARSAVWLEGSARDAAHRLKYEGWWRIADSMALAMRGLAPLTAGVTLVPIPLGARRFNRRGYNQSERLAAALGRQLGLPVAESLLRRTRETPTQTALTPEARHANMAGAFESAGASGVDIVLVDDVFTTGATLVSAAAALKAGGAARVAAVTFARARAPIG